MKELMLLNPVRRRRRSRRKAGRRRRFHAMKNNPVRRRRRRKGRRSSIIRHSRRSRFRRNPIGGKRRRRRSGGGGGGGRLTIGSLASREMLTTAGGAVLGGFLTDIIMGQFGPMKVVSGTFVPKAAGEFKLPLSETPYGNLAYNILLPVVGALVVQRFDKNIARGMALSGAVLGIRSVVAMVRGAVGGSTVAAAGGYLDAGGTLRALPRGSTPGYNAVNAFGASPLDNASAFRQNTWAMERN